jgi:hypothetical protein
VLIGVRRTIAFCTGGVAVAIAVSLLAVWLKGSGGGPGDIGWALVIFTAVGLQSVPAAGIVAVSWPKSGALRAVLIVLLALVVALSLLFFLVPAVLALGVTAVFTQLLLSGRRAAFVAWMTLSVPCLILGTAVLVWAVVL